MRPLPAALLLALTACYDDDDCDGCGGGPPPVPVFSEQEPNDQPLQANDFGLIQPGDHFFIDGFVRDDPADPFDGFAFTAGGPLHVDFLLFASGGDLDVCLYDPLLDQTLACYATDLDPEVGGVDVSGGGFDFHLVVESFAGDSAYSLEIVVQPLFAAVAEGAVPDASTARLRAVDPRALRTPRAEAGYRRAAPERPLAELEERLWLDPASGVALVLRRRVL